ncbi:cupin domain-containing protein [Pseudothauera nasutitermitis]|uniref:Cupin domain-containing protein n=1 Tax=Pseudothauera nasutitermitis TaxID=2565930 RepID=A0A4V3WC60_9RHOO|nr:cupin domain-containing protein [Pseudothauera nasutitermitis]THF65745.1 cupin domain-containing protein [Pseudothauera nasutitermitis]
MIDTFLGGLSPRRFLDEYWQKKPLLVRQAIPGFTGVVSRERLFELACDPDVESRWVRHDGDTWEVEHGPQRPGRLRGKRTPWTVLVQGMNLWEAAADELLHCLDFIPQARLDDLMVSYAVDGGGVGPHFDNYDVFLIQGMGKRRWRIGDQSDHQLVEGAPLRILKNFQPIHDWVLETGDLLYLPPHWAHDGIAIGECMTHSIGFRTPTAQEVGAGFLDWLHEHTCLDGVYADPDLAAQDNSARIPEAMIDQVDAMLRQICWDRDAVAGFLGEYLTEPKAHVFFDPPEKPLAPARFAQRVEKSGFRLDARSVLLFHGGRFFLNGESVDAPAAAHATLQRLAHARRLPAGGALDPAVLALLHAWYRDGYGHPGTD